MLLPSVFYDRGNFLLIRFISFLISILVYDLLLEHSKLPHSISFSSLSYISWLPLSIEGTWFWFVLNSEIHFAGPLLMIVGCLVVHHLFSSPSVLKSERTD